MKYNALSLIFIRIRDLPWLQWHPFSVSSSPLDGKHHLSVLIKVLGDWTGEMRDKCSNVLEQSREVLPCQPYSRITAYVEGPYGHDSAYHLAYELYSSSSSSSFCFVLLWTKLSLIRVLRPNSMLQNLNALLMQIKSFKVHIDTE